MPEYLNQENHIESLISDLTFFIDTHPSFQGKLVDEIIESYEKTGVITKKQLQALESIHDKWNVSHYLQMKMYGELIDTELI
jgi:hypothetical protein